MLKYLKTNLLFLILYIVLWVFLYYLEGTHDAFITLETNEHPPAEDYIQSNFYKGKWHTLDSYSYAIFHIVFSLFAATLLKQGMFHVSFLAFLSISISVRIIFHDLFYDIGVKRSILTVPSYQGSWNWYDGFLIWVYNTFRINPFPFKFIPLTLSVIFYFLITS